jgi:tubulin-folding cofactor B
MNDKTYDKLEDTARKFKERQMTNNPAFAEAMNANKIPEDFCKEEAEKMEKENRCELTMGNRRGKVAYIGKVHPLGAGYWIGVILDEPSGDSNGTVKGRKLFECPNKFGIFTRPTEL